MRNLKPPTDLDNKVLLDEIIAAKKDENRRNELQEKKPNIIQRYQEYLNKYNEGNLAPITDSKYPQSDPALLSCYLSGGTRLSDIKNHIRNLQSDLDNEKCMYCRIKEPDSFDHFIPKDPFPEFSIYSLNLIPCCIKCNKTKDRFWREDGYHAIINFYRDKIPEIQFLFATITFVNDTDIIPSTKFFISQKNGIDISLYNIIEKHFDRLKLIDQYQEHIGTALSELDRIIKSYGKDLSIERCIEATKEYANELKTDYGINYWKAIFYNSLCDSIYFERKYG